MDKHGLRIINYKNDVTPFTEIKTELDIPDSVQEDIHMLSFTHNNPDIFGSYSRRYNNYQAILILLNILMVMVMMKLLMHILKN